MNKFIIPIIVTVVVAAGIGAFLVFQKPAFPEQQRDKSDIIEENSPFAIHDPGKPTSSNDITSIGAKWVRYAGGDGLVWGAIEKQKRQFNWEYHDKLYLETFKKGVKIFVSIIPANELDQPTGQSPENVPKNMSAFKEFLKMAVERYDGDGIDDAPGSPIVSVWQVGNELDLSPNKSSPREHAQFLKESYKVIKFANSAAKVAVSGVAGPEGFDGVRAFYLPFLKELSQVRDNPQDRYFDIFDFHWYPFESQYSWLTEPISGAKRVYLNEYIENIKQTLAEYGYENTPIFITETAQYSGTPIPPKFTPPQTTGPFFKSHSEKEQSFDLIKQYIYSLGNGVKKIFWATLTEWHNFGGEPGTVWDNIGLINNPSNDGQSHKKLSYYTYKKMVEVLEGSEWDNIQTIQESDGVYIYKFMKAGKPIWVAWNDNSASKTITITGIGANQVKITEAVPKYESGKDVTDYNTAFNTETKVVSGGKITITLSDKPVFAEEK